MTVSIPSNTLEKFTTFGDLLRFLRRRVGLTQTELAIAVGYSHTQISRLEQNLRLPDIPTIESQFIPALGLEDEPKAVARLLDLAANIRREDAPALGLCPYKGLNYFDEADADLFVGREVLTAKLVERVLSLTSNGPAAKRNVSWPSLVRRAVESHRSCGQAWSRPYAGIRHPLIGKFIFLHPRLLLLKVLQTSLTVEISDLTSAGHIGG